MKKALMESPLKLGLLLFFSRFQSLSCADIAWRQTMTISRRFRPSSSTVLFYHSSLSLNPIASRSILTISGIHSYAVSSSLSRLESERDVFGSRWKQWRENRRREKKKANLILKQSSWNHALIVFHLSSWCIYWKTGSDMLRSLWLKDGLCGRQRQWEEWDLIERDEDSMSVIEIRESISFHFIV